MKVVREETLIDVGGFSASDEWRTIQRQVLSAIRSIEWPTGSGSFTLYPESGKKHGEGNGVGPIKDACMLFLRDAGWELETRLDVATAKVPGPIDATCRVGDRRFCVEWETGNISSSHRALNKIALGMQIGVLAGGILIVPTREMYRYLTDRVGNWDELVPYFPLWRSLAPTVSRGLLSVTAIEQDAVSRTVPRIRKLTDGRALR